MKLLLQFRASRRLVSWCGIISLPALVGCQELPSAQNETGAALLSLSHPLLAPQFALESIPNLKPIEIVVANSSDVSSGKGAGGDYGEIARMDLNEFFANSPNYIVANRSLNRQATAEIKLRQTAGNQALITPVTPKFILKATVMEVEREIKSDGTKTAWQYVITASSAKAQRQGAVEVMVEVVDLDTLRTLFVTRCTSLLYDTTKETSVGLLLISNANKSSIRVPEADAIRCACQEAAQKAHAYLVGVTK